MKARTARPGSRHAPVFHVDIEGPLEFQGDLPWEEVRHGRNQDSILLAGRRGLGRDTFPAAATDRDLPTEIPIPATLTGTAADGSVGRCTTERKGRSRGARGYGYIRVPDDARPGPARVRFEVPQDAPRSVEPWELPVVIVKPKP